MYDVTRQCADIQGGADKVTADCPLVELWVTSASGNIEDSPMWRTTGDSEGSTTIALTDVSANYGTELITEGLRPPGHRFRHTNGVVSKYPAMIESYKATLQFGTGVCWYVDTSFCASFHDMKKTHGNEGAKTIMLAITWLQFGTGVCWYVDTSFCASFHDMKKTHGEFVAAEDHAGNVAQTVRHRDDRQAEQQPRDGQHDGLGPFVAVRLLHIVEAGAEARVNVPANAGAELQRRLVALDHGGVLRDDAVGVAEAE